MTIVTDENHAPGRKRLVRRGRVDVFWVASPAAVKAGYVPKTVFLREDTGEIVASLEIAMRCRALWSEMQEYLAGVPRGTRFPVGTIAWLAETYQTDPDSPYRRIRASTKPGYDNALGIVSASVGQRRIESVTGNDVRRWFQQWGRAGADGVVTQGRRAYWCVQVLRIAMKFGKGQRFPGCRELSEILTDAEFPMPRGRRTAMTVQQADAFMAKAKERDRASIAVAVALQFGCALRQKDVIGEWIKTANGRQWTSGLLWNEHVRPDWTLAKPTSKTNFKEIAEFDLKMIPFVLSELQAIPLTARIGPVIRDENTERPFRQREFARLFREIARAAGIPDDVWNMDTRAGAVTDARAKGATRADSMDLATHTQEATNRRYDRDRISATNRVSVLRFGGTNEHGKSGS